MNGKRLSRQRLPLAVNKIIHRGIKMSTSLRLRKGIASDWTSVNPVLATGEPGFETDARKLKMGDGSTAWNDLPYVTIDGGDMDMMAPTTTTVAPTTTTVAPTTTTVAPTTTTPTPNNPVTNALSSYNAQYTGEYNLITGKARPTTTRSFTVEGWVKWDNSASSCVGTFMGGPSDTARQPHFLCVYFDDNYWNGSQTVNGSNIRVDGYFLSQNLYVPTSNFAKNVWYHVAVSRNAANSNVEAVWVNGVRCGGTQNDNRVYDANSLTIGNGWPNPQNNKKFIGYQTDMRVISNAYVYNPTSSTITVPSAPLTTTSDCVALIQSNASGALATDNSAVRQSLTFVGLSHNSSSPYAGGGAAGGSWFNPDGNGAIVMDPGVYNC
jgi:Major tropism determinant N-terminal domain/Concanavalin A-like lectin/glucanases superfamily